MRPFNLDNEGKSYFINFLRKDTRFSNIVDTDETSQFTHWDVTSVFCGKTVAYELKCRDCYSYTFGDTEINKYKYDYLKEAPYDIVVLVTFFKDKWCMINIRKTPPSRVYQKLAQLSHRWARGKTYREFVSWDLDDTIKLQDY